MNDSEYLIFIGKPYIQHLRQCGDRFKISRKVKGSHNPSVVKGEILRRKMQQIQSHIVSIGVMNFEVSNTTNSIYFTYNRFQYRISDHNKKAFAGISILVKWDSDIQQIIDFYLT